MNCAKNAHKLYPECICFFIEWYNYTMSKKIAKVVLNSTLHEARVTTEVQSLSETRFQINL